MKFLEILLEPKQQLHNTHMFAYMWFFYTQEKLIIKVVIQKKKKKKPN